MKKYILIAAIVLTALNTQAQKFDKDLLYGKWVAVGIKADGIVFHPDSINVALALMNERIQEEDSNHIVSAADTARIQQIIKETAKELKGTYMDFSPAGVLIRKVVKGEPKTTNYEWVNDTELLIDGKGKLCVYRLDSKHLTVATDCAEGKEGVVVYLQKK